jgi:RNA polymerase sigma factor (sigma-70 family)
MNKSRRGHVLSRVRTVFGVGTTGELTDGQLLERFATRDDEAAELAFAALVERHGPMVLRTCRTVLRDLHGAEDAFQATFLVLVKKRRGLWVRDSLGPWLHQVACRVSARARSEAARRRKVEAQAAELLPRSASETPPDDLGRVLHEELERLPEPFRAAVVLCCLEGLTLHEAARRLGWPLGTVQSRLARGRQRLRDCLARRGFAPTFGAVGLALAGERAQAAVPPALAEATAQVAVRGAAGGVLPLAAGSLMEGVLTAMTLSRLKLIVAGILVVTAGVGSGTWLPRFVTRASAQDQAKGKEAKPPRPADEALKTTDREGYKQALAVIEAMARDNPKDAEYRAALARSHLLLGIHLQKRGRTQEAEATYRQARELLETLAREQPEIVSHRIDLAGVDYRLATLLLAIGRHPEAEASFRRAVAILERLAQEHPALTQARADLARTHAKLGTLMKAVGRLAEGEALVRQALEIQRRLVELQPALVEFRSDLADSYEALASLLEATGRSAEAERALRQAESIRVDLATTRRKDIRD